MSNLSSTISFKVVYRMIAVACMVLFLFGTNIPTAFATDYTLDQLEGRAYDTDAVQYRIDGHNLDPNTVTYSRGTYTTIRGVPTWVASDGQRITCSLSTRICTENDVSSGPIEQIGQFFADNLFKTVLFLVITIFQLSIWILGISGVLLEFVINNFVLGMAGFVGKGGLISEAVAAAWSAIRDIANIAFIGGLVWASIAMILNIAPTQGGKSNGLIIKLLVAALLVNFSFFFAGLIVDASNFLSGEIYDAGIGKVEGQTAALIGTQTPQQATGSAIDPLTTTRGMGAVFMDKTRLSSILSPEALRAEDPSLSILFAAILGIALFGTTAYVFFNITFLLVARFVILILLLITSPIGVLYFTGISQLQDWGKKWWGALSQQAIFAPVFFLLAGISISIISALSRDDIIQSATLSELANGDFSNAISILALFVVSIGFMLASLKISEDMSRKGEAFKSVFGGMDRARNWAVSGLGTASRLAGRGVGVATGAAGGAAGFVGGALTSGTVAGTWNGVKAGYGVGEKTGKGVYGFATTPLNSAADKASKQIESKKIFFNKDGEKYYKKDASEFRSNFQKQSSAYGSPEFQKLQAEVQVLTDEELLEKYKDAKTDKEKGNILLAGDGDQRKLLRGKGGAPRETAEERLEEIQSKSQSLDGDSRIATASAQPLEPGYGDLAELRGLLQQIARSEDASTRTAAQSNLLERLDQKREMLENKRIITALNSLEYKELKNSMQASGRDTSAVDEFRYAELADHAKNGNEEGVKESLKKVGGEGLPPELAKHELVVKVQTDMKVSPAGAITPKTPQEESTERRQRRTRRANRNNTRRSS